MGEMRLPFGRGHREITQIPETPWRAGIGGVCMRVPANAGPTRPVVREQPLCPSLPRTWDDLFPRGQELRPAVKNATHSLKPHS